MLVRCEHWARCDVKCDCRNVHEEKPLCSEDCGSRPHKLVSMPRCLPWVSDEAKAVAALSERVAMIEDAVIALSARLRTLERVAIVDGKI